MKIHWRPFLAALLLVVSLPGLAELPTDDSDWELQKDDAGIRIYTRDVPGSDFQAFKAVTDLDAPLENVIAVMANPKSCLDWVHGCIRSDSFDDENFNDRYAYSVNDLPWPAQDRDYVLHMITTSDPETGEIDMQLNAEGGVRPDSEDYVRVDHSETLYRFLRNDDGTTHMIWIQHSEPNGALPSWLVNSLAMDLPFKSLQSLEKLAQQPRYQNHKILYDEKGHIVGVVLNKDSASVAKTDEDDAQ
ncbi:START domain-containing protein [Marinobacteraceae bacterium S3BR75-40.1]